VIGLGISIPSSRGKIAEPPHSANQIRLHVAFGGLKLPYQRTDPGHSPRARIRDAAGCPLRGEKERPMNTNRIRRQDDLRVPLSARRTQMAVRESRILGIGSLSDVEAWSGYDYGDYLADQVLAPGFVDSHCHLIEVKF
jgi:hypothetical protein